MKLPVEIAQIVRFLEGPGDGWPAILLIGLIAGFIARSFTTTRQQIGLFSTLTVGVAGALGGTVVCALLEIPVDGLGARFLAAVAGSLVLLLVLGPIVRLFRRRSAAYGESKPRAAD